MTDKEPSAQQEAGQQEAGQQEAGKPTPLLVNARKRLGLTQRAVADRLRLKLDTVRQLEEGDLESLGTQVYAKGHLRAYAKLVGVPGDKVLAQYAATIGRMGTGSFTHRPPPKKALPPMPDLGKLAASAGSAVYAALASPIFPRAALAAICLALVTGLLIWGFGERDSAPAAVQPASQPGLQQGQQQGLQPGQPRLSPALQPGLQPAGQTRLQPGVPGLQPGGQALQPEGQQGLQSGISPRLEPGLQPAGQQSLQPAGQQSLQPAGQQSLQLPGPQSLQPPGQQGVQAPGQQLLLPEPQAGEAQPDGAGLSNKRPTYQVYAGGEDRLEFLFTGDCQLVVADSRNVEIYRRAHKRMDRVIVKGASPFNINLSQAAAVELLYNNQPVDLTPHYTLENPVAELVVNDDALSLQ